MKTLNFVLLVSFVTSIASLVPLKTYGSQLIFSEQSKFQKFSNLENVSQSFNLKINPENFILATTKKSLLGTHYYYQQAKNGNIVDHSQVIITVNNQGEVTKVYDSSAEDNGIKASTIPFISKDMAIKFAWEHLKVNGDLLATPEAKLVYSENMQLVYKVAVATSSPFGYWSLVIDAQNGKVIEVVDTSLPRMKREARFIRKNTSRLTNLSEALAKIQVKNLGEMLKSNGDFVNGSAQVFDPNPVATLKTSDIADNSDSSVFIPAYTTTELTEITFSNGLYHLAGPNVRLIDFEGPSIAPTVSTNGNWISPRGNNIFNDAMTYVHIDRSIRYIESLGYDNERAIFKGAIEVDADGVQGTDNSHYIPGSNRLAFGHGCVDDNEDADVILHELGHAIQSNINHSWAGGDTGAMGEGFGDYWAASYSATLPGGQDFHPEWVFKWDGHNACWKGRNLNAFMPKYNPNAVYQAHSMVDGGISDELWSTPIYQAFLELYNRGVPRASMDKIILEAHFGFGWGVKIPDMARSIVKTAKALFPNEDYDQVYLKHFKNQKIL